MVDFHSHILPRIDDGSRSTEESVQMLECLAAQGVSTVAFTSHFYAGCQSAEQFLEQRQAALERLAPAMSAGMPEFRLGAEVYFFRGISDYEWLPSLCIQGTRVLLLEMPFAPWSESEVREVIELCGDPAFVILLAHIDRYEKYQKAVTWDRLLSAGAMMQSNADFFLHPLNRGKAVRMVREGRIHVLGSDCHNMDSRPPRMGEAAAVLEKRLGTQAARQFAARSEGYLGEWSL